MPTGCIVHPLKICHVVTPAFSRSVFRVVKRNKVAKNRGDGTQIRCPFFCLKRLSVFERKMARIWAGKKKTRKKNLDFLLVFSSLHVVNQITFVCRICIVFYTIRNSTCTIDYMWCANLCECSLPHLINPSFCCEYVSSDIIDFLRRWNPFREPPTSWSADFSLGTPRAPSPLHWLVFVRGCVLMCSCVHVCTAVVWFSLPVCRS